MYFKQMTAFLVVLYAIAGMTMVQAVTKAECDKACKVACNKSEGAADFTCPSGQKK